MIDTYLERITRSEALRGLKRENAMQVCVLCTTEKRHAKQWHGRFACSYPTLAERDADIEWGINPDNIGKDVYVEEEGLPYRLIGIEPTWHEFYVELEEELAEDSIIKGDTTLISLRKTGYFYCPKCGLLYVNLEEKGQ
jgi:hypothetical protein